jgi:uracil-DNA glycosylase family 4
MHRRAPCLPLPPSLPLPHSLPLLHRDIIRCVACPRLVAWRKHVAREKVARFRDSRYWGRPVPGFGDPNARILIVGLAPGAHGANRTGRMFTGDRSGDFLFAAMHRAGLANQPASAARNDGLELHDAYIVAAVRCAPPDNKPAPGEISRCAHFLDDEVALLPRVRVVLALGAIAWRAYLDLIERAGGSLPRPRPAFAHGALVDLSGPAARPPYSQAVNAPARTPRPAHTLLGSYHVSQQNTLTGKLTPEMFDAVLRAAVRRTHGSM